MGHLEDAYRRIIEAISLGDSEALDVEGDRVAARVTWRGTHRGDFVGLRPTNKPVSFSAFHVVRFSGNRVVEWWGTADLLGALQRLGATISGP